MRIAYFDCFNGASGDMILGALLDAGADLQTLRESLGGLGLGDVVLNAERVTKQGFAATRVVIEHPPQKSHRHLADLLKLIDGAGFSPRVREQVGRIFQNLARAEASVHASSIEAVHFHEVGAVDAIVDVAGSCLALELLHIDQVLCGPIPVGAGTVRCAHGILPVPAPATLELLRGVPIVATDETGELTTPTGAAILVTLAKEFGGPPGMTVRGSGSGAGARDGQAPQTS